MTHSALLSSLDVQAGNDTATVDRGWLGLGIGNPPHGHHPGVVVCRVQPGSPAEHAGIKPGDVLLSLNGLALTDATHLKEELEKLAAGSPIQLMRKGHQHALELTLGQMPQ